MGCKQSKAIEEKDYRQAHPDVASSSAKDGNPKSLVAAASSSSSAEDDRVFQLLVQAAAGNGNSSNSNSNRLLSSFKHNNNVVSPKQAAYQSPTTKSTPLHMAVKLLNHTPATSTATNNSSTGNSASSNDGLEAVIEGLIRAYPDAVSRVDAAGHIPLHYAVAPERDGDGGDDDYGGDNNEQSSNNTPASYKLRRAIVRRLIAADMELSLQYLQRNDVVFANQHDQLNNNSQKNSKGSKNSTMSTGCTPFYRALQMMPDDFETNPAMSETVLYCKLLTEAVGGAIHIGNADSGDKPLALLYRRFTRQFDLAEKFFSGDNSRKEVVTFRQQYKAAAGNTWKMIEIILSCSNQQQDPTLPFRTIHSAVQVETPPDLLRYIVETNAEDLTVFDEAGNLPLHYAAQSKPLPFLVETTTIAAEEQEAPPGETNQQQEAPHQHYPAFYTKYVMDELLYKYPEAASKPNADGKFPLTLAIQSGKHWIGGGVRSLYDAYPEAIKQIENLEQYANLKWALSMESEGDQEQASPPKQQQGIQRDEPHDAIMLVQQPQASVNDVVTSMWAHEEDAGVQMLGCVALAKKLRQCQNDKQVLNIAVSAVAAVVNAMKAHPNEVIIQEKACHALKCMASADRKREVSFVASGAIAAIVGAMQAHVSDPGVQEEGCDAIARIIHYGGGGGDDRATIVASVSGLTALVNAIAAHPHQAAVQANGCAALVALTDYAETANLPELPRSQTEPLLVAAKQAFPKECAAHVDVLLSRLSS